MPKTSTDAAAADGRIALSGPTMGTRWSALFHARPGFDSAPLRAALQAAVDEVDAEMSTWKPGSDLMRINAGPVGVWLPAPRGLMTVLGLGLRIGRASGGAFDIGMGDAVAAWGFGADEADGGRIRRALAAPRRPAHEVLELDPARRRLRKAAPVTLDLNGIAKGHGVDRLAGTLAAFGIGAGLVGIDGELRAVGLRPDGQPWTIAIEEPDPARRAPHSVLALQDAAVATSGDYRHRVTLAGRTLSHTMDPRRAAPLDTPPASVTVVAPTCAEADAFATALMVLGPVEGADLARRLGLDALFLLREGGAIRQLAVGALFAAEPASGGAGA